MGVALGRGARQDGGRTAAHAGFDGQRAACGRFGGRRAGTARLAGRRRRQHGPRRQRPQGDGHGGLRPCRPDRSPDLRALHRPHEHLFQQPRRTHQQPGAQRIQDLRQQRPAAHHPVGRQPEPRLLHRRQPRGEHQRPRLHPLPRRHAVERPEFRCRREGRRLHGGQLPRRACRQPPRGLPGVPLHRARQQLRGGLRHQLRGPRRHHPLQQLPRPQMAQPHEPPGESLRRQPRQRQPQQRPRALLQQHLLQSPHRRRGLPHHGQRQVGAGEDQPRLDCLQAAVLLRHHHRRRRTLRERRHQGGDRQQRHLRPDTSPTCMPSSASPTPPKPRR